MHPRPDQPYSQAHPPPSMARRRIHHTQERPLSFPTTTQFHTPLSLQLPPVQRHLTTSPCHHPQHLPLSQHLNFHNQLPTPQPKPLAHLAPRNNPLLPPTHNSHIPHTPIAHAPHYPDIEQAADRDNTDHHLTIKDPLDDIQHHEDDDTQHHEDATTDAVAANPPAAGPPTLDDGWIPDRAYPAPEAGEDLHEALDAGLQAPPAALHPGRAHPPHQESGCNLLTSFANNFSG